MFVQKHVDSVYTFSTTICTRPPSFPILGTVGFSVINEVLKKQIDVQDGFDAERWVGTTTFQAQQHIELNVLSVQSRYRRRQPSHLEVIYRRVGLRSCAPDACFAFSSNINRPSTPRANPTSNKKKEHKQSYDQVIS